jgi:hypothetical protein
MQVYIVTGNHYPAAVFAKRKDAEAFAKAKQANKDKPKASPDVMWVVKEFNVR